MLVVLVNRPSYLPSISVCHVLRARGRSTGAKTGRGGKIERSRQKSKEMTDPTDEEEEEEENKKKGDVEKHTEWSTFGH